MSSLQGGTLEYATCCISLEVMVDPVVCSDGISYERAYIEQWFATGHTRSPSSNVLLATFDVIPNVTLRSLIQHLTQTKAAAVAAEPPRGDLDRKVAMLEARLRQLELERVRDAREKTELESIVAALSSSDAETVAAPRESPSAYQLGDVLITAACRGDLAEVHRLTGAGAATNRMRGFTNKFGTSAYLTALGHAAMYGHVSVVQHLWNLENTSGLLCDYHASLLHYAAAFGHLNLARFSVESADGLSNVDRLDDFGYTPLMTAAVFNQMAMVRHLCEVLHASVNQRGGQGLTALHIAAYAGAHEIICYLCESRDADAFVRDDRGAEPVVCAGFSRMYDSLEPGTKARVMKYLRAREKLAGRRR